MIDIILHIPGNSYTLTGEEAVKLADLLLCMTLEQDLWSTLKTAECDRFGVSSTEEQWASKAHAYTIGS